MLPSKPVMVFTTTKPHFASAKFVYNYYEKNEFVELSPNIEKPPRLAELNFSPISSILQNNVLGNYFNQYIQQIMAQNDRFTSELLLQSSGYIKYTSDTERDYSFYSTSDLGSAEDKSKFTAFFENASTNQGQEFVDTPDDTSIYLNTTTNRPTSKSADIYSQQANESLIASDFCFDLIEASAANPFSIHSKKNHNDLRDLKTLQSRTRRRTNPALVSSADYVMPVDFLDFENADEIFRNVDTISGMGIIAYIVFKSEVDELGNDVEQLGSFIITGLETSSFSDNEVKYGARYKYNIHPMYIIKPEPNQPNVFVMIGAKGKSVKLHCVENIPPPPIEAIEFRYKGNAKIGLNWSPPTQYGNIPDVPVGDIKGYQVFIRESYDSPFEIKKYITFNDMIGLENFPVQESIPEKLVFRCSYHPVHWTLDLQRDQDYIIAMCVIDAHGNSSNLSPQYIVKIDSATNTLKIDFASYKGAPKQYPNMLMSNKIFLDSMKVSNKNKMTVYFDPKLTRVNLSQNSVDPISVLPDSTDSVPSYRMQLINVTKQSDKIVDIYIKNNN